MDIIMDRKKKRHYLMLDEDVNDPLGTEEAKRNKAKTIEIPKGSKNPLHISIASMGLKAQIGRRGYFLNDKKDMVSGMIVDIIPPYFVVLRGKGVFKMEDCISLGG